MRAILTERPRGDQAGGYSAPQASGVRFSSGQSSIGVMPDIMSPDDAMVQHTSSGSAGAGSAGVGSAGAAGAGVDLPPQAARVSESARLTTVMS